MAAVWIVPALRQVVIPLVLLVWQATSRDRVGLVWLMKTVAVAGYLEATALTGLWLIAPWYLPYALLLASLVVSAWRSPRPFQFLPRIRARERLALVGWTLAAVLAFGAVGAAIESRRPPTDVVDLAFPLRDGTYYIANGGGSGLTNAHLMTLDARYSKHRGQSYGVDILKLNAYGYHAEGTAPRDPAGYAIFGDTIYAPCDGVVAWAEDWLPDLSPPEVDRAHLPGNFVLVECGDEVQVLIAHMRSGSVRVHPGDYVTTMTRLGEVGNSGNSNEPHLHIHAQRPGRPWDLFVGDPLPIRLDGRYLVRNDRVTITGPFGGDEGDEID